MVANGYHLLNDLPNFCATFPKEMAKATAAGQQEGCLTWRDRPVFPGLAFRFTWPASKPYGFSMRRGKYGTPTSLRVHYAKAGLGMPREAMPGAGRRKTRSGAGPPNLDKPWFYASGGTRAKMLAKRPKTTISGGSVITRYKPAGWGINLLGGPNHRGIASAHWVHIPITYQMKVYKDAVAKAGAYTMTVTRAIPRWVYTHSTRTYRQEFEDLTHDLPFIQRITEAAIRNHVRDLIVDKNGKVRLRFRRGFTKAGLALDELNAIAQGAA
jgi:hypothetical protein